MPLEPLDDEQLREAVTAWEENKGNWASTARALGLNSRSSAQNRVHQAFRKLPEFKGRAPLPGFKITKLSTRLDAEGNVEGEFVQQKPEADGQFTMPEGHALKGVSAYLDGQGNVVGQWVKTKAGELDPLAVVETIKEALESYEPPARQATPPPTSFDADVANVFLIPDAHMGLMAWGRETGGPDYDLKIATATIRQSLGRLAANTPPGNTAVVLGVGDNSHTDGYKNVTPQSGHALDADGRWPKILDATIDMFVYAADVVLPTHQNVIIRVLPGNHDPQTSIAVTAALARYYRDEPRVTVVKDMGLFWWWEWGSALVGAVHGDKAKMKDLPLTMAARNAEAWGRTRFRYIYTGHIHHQTAIEMGGVIVESFQSPAAQDAYNAGMGYSNGRSLKSISIHRTDGEVGRQTVNIV